MTQKTTVDAAEGQHDIFINREFDLPLSLLFKAYSEPALLEQWMGTNVRKLENKAHGSWRFETTDPQGNIVFGAHGTIHTFLPDQKIIRTFEMDNAPFGVQLEILEFEAVTDRTSRLRMHTVYETVALRDQMLKLPFRQGLNMAHNRLQEIISKLA